MDINVVNGDKDAVDALIQNKKLLQLALLVQHLAKLFMKIVLKMKKEFKLEC